VERHNWNGSAWQWMERDVDRRTETGTPVQRKICLISPQSLRKNPFEPGLPENSFLQFKGLGSVATRDNYVEKGFKPRNIFANLSTLTKAVTVQTNFSAVDIWRRRERKRVCQSEKGKESCVYSQTNGSFLNGRWPNL
jgi:hypothetical protein